MQINLINSIEELLGAKGYIVLDDITIDSFGRFHGVLTDKSKNKYFLKAVSTDNKYAYRSLKSEIRLNYLLSEITQKNDISVRSKKLMIPNINKVVESGCFLCMISEYAEGNLLINEPPETQSRYLIHAADLITVLSQKVDLNKISQDHKNYSKIHLLITSVFKLFKAVILTPKLLPKLLLAYFQVIPVFKYTYRLSLIHADLNASNIIFSKEYIYLIDWEEAGTGISDFNYITPLSVHWTDEIIKDQMFKKLYSENSNFKPLLAYRILVMFNQKICPSDSRRIRDLELLNYVISS